MTSSQPVWPPTPGHPPAVVDTTPLPSSDAVRWGKLQARDVMRADVLSVASSASIADVERTLLERRVGGAPVRDDAGRVVGIVSMRDILRARQPSVGHDPDLDGLPVPSRGSGWNGHLPAAATARDVMNPEVYWVDGGAGLGDVARTMVSQHVHRVLVRDQDRYAGIIGTLDLLHAMAG
jgi:CBS domain-containing protein